MPTTSAQNSPSYELIDCYHGSSPSRLLDVELAFWLALDLVDDVVESARAHLAAGAWVTLARVVLNRRYFPIELLDVRRALLRHFAFSMAWTT
jgi:hypothetical protein